MLLFQLRPLTAREGSSSLIEVDTFNNHVQDELHGWSLSQAAAAEKYIIRDPKPSLRIIDPEGALEGLPD